MTDKEHSVLSRGTESVGTGHRGSTGTKKVSGRHVNSRKEGYAGAQHKSGILKQVLAECDANYFTTENIENLNLLTDEQKEVYEKHYKSTCSISTWALICYLVSDGRRTGTSGCVTDKGVQACDTPGSGTCLLPRTASQEENDFKYGHAQVWLKYFVNSLGKPVEIIETYGKLTKWNPFEVMKEDADKPQVVQMMAPQATPAIPTGETKIIGVGSKSEIEDEYIPRGEDVTNYVKNGNYKILEIVWSTDNPMSVLIAGHKGTGKTQVVRTFAYENKIPCVTLDCSNETSEEQLKGSLINLGTYQLGVIPKAFEIANKYGKCILHLDEMSCLLKSEQKLLNSLLDWRREISIPETNQVYRLRKGAKLLVVGTMNPLTTRNDYEVEKLNPDLKSRFLQFSIPYPKDSELKKIVKANIKDPEFMKILEADKQLDMTEDEDAITYNILDQFIKTSVESQEKDVGYVYSPRDLVNSLRFLRLTYQFNISSDNPEYHYSNDDDAFNNALKETCKQLVAKADPDEQRALADVVNGNFSHIVGDIDVEE